MTKKLKKFQNYLAKKNLLLIPYLKSKGYSYQLLQKYYQNNWTKKISKGVYYSETEDISLFDVIHALVEQAGFKIHIAGISALKVFGYYEQIDFRSKYVLVYSQKRIFKPKWLKIIELKKNFKIELVYRTFLKTDEFIKEVYVEKKPVPVSIPERAVLEAINEIRNYEDYIEFLKVFETIINLNPQHLDELLISCKSVKVKRLFLFLSENYKKPYFEKLNLNKYNLGNGVREVFKSKDNKYISKYKLMVPEILDF